MSALLFDWYGGVVGTRLFTAMSGGYVTYTMYNEIWSFIGCQRVPTLTPSPLQAMCLYPVADGAL